MTLSGFQMGVILVGLAIYFGVLYYVDRSLEPRWRPVLRISATALNVLAAVWVWGKYVPTGQALVRLAPHQVGLLVVGTANYFGFVYFVDDTLAERFRSYWRYVIAAVTAWAFFYAMQEYVPDHDKSVKIVKAAVAMTAAAAVFYEQHRKSIQRPIAERWKKFVGITLALAAITCYFNGFRFGYPPYYHRWDQYHYYMGAKYFDELGYDGLYKCGVVAQDDMGVVTYTPNVPQGADLKYQPTRRIDMTKEMRDPDKKIRNLSGDNLLINVKEILANAEECQDRFTPERWEEYKEDVKFYRLVSSKDWWGDMQRDHGFNPPPVWTIAGQFFSEIHPAGVNYLQFLATLDLLYIIGMFVALYWAFGWRVFAVGAVFWGCQSSAPFYWTGGAFLRQDWLFFLVLSVCCIRKRCFKIAGAALVYTGLLRIFPGLVVIGTLVPFVAHIIKKRRIHPDHKQMLLGGVLAAAILVPASAWITSKEWRENPTNLAAAVEPYKKFKHHTLNVHDKTPLTNHMGLRTIIAHKFFDFQAAWPPIKVAVGPESGRMKYTRDNSRLDPFELWKDMRNERYEKYKPVAYGIILASLAAFIFAVRRVKSLWVAQCLAQIFIILLSQLTCYYYSFMILSAPLAKVRRQIELGLFALAAITEIIWLNSYWNDDKYTALTIVSLLFCYFLLFLFWPRPASLAAVRARLGRGREARVGARG